MKLKEISEAVLVCGKCQSRIAGRDLLCGEASDEPLFLSDFIDPSSAWHIASLVRKLDHPAGSGLSEDRLLAALEANPREFEEWAVDLRCPECSAKIDSSSSIRCAAATD